MGLESIHRSEASVRPYRARRTSRKRPAGPACTMPVSPGISHSMMARLTPTITTSYFPSVTVGLNSGLNRGRGGANEGRTRKSRDDVAYSVKTGIAQMRIEYRS